MSPKLRRFVPWLEAMLAAEADDLVIGAIMRSCTGCIVRPPSSAFALILQSFLLYQYGTFEATIIALYVPIWYMLVDNRGRVMYHIGTVPYWNTMRRDDD